MNYNQAKAFARELRKNQTEAETEFWNQVRNRRFRGLKFTRQFLVLYKLFGATDRYFIADFHCHEHKLIVEIDGGYHEHQRTYDENRTAILEKMDYRIVRFTNEEVINDWASVEKTLLSMMS